MTCDFYYSVRESNGVHRNNIAAAKLAGLMEDLNLTSVQFEVRFYPVFFIGPILDMGGGAKFEGGRRPLVFSSWDMS
jgi:hypothetical protein